MKMAFGYEQYAQYPPQLHEHVVFTLEGIFLIGTLVPIGFFIGTLVPIFSSLSKNAIFFILQVDSFSLLII